MSRPRPSSAPSSAHGTRAKAPEPSTRASELVYEKLCTALIRLEIAPGALLNERELAQSMGVARPTIVHALHRLSETGLISILPRRGVLVAPVDLLDVQQVFDARVVIEGALAAMAAVRATSEEVQAIRELQSEVDRLKEVDRNHSSFLDLDQRLHFRIGAVARNRFLQNDLERVWKVNSRLWHVFFRERGTKADYFLSHAEILDALERHDPEAARAAVRGHLGASKEMLLSGLWGV